MIFLVQDSQEQVQHDIFGRAKSALQGESCTT